MGNQNPMRRRQANRTTGRGPGGRIGTASLPPIALLTAAIASNGTQLVLTFSRPATLTETASDIALDGNYRTLAGASVSILGNVATVTLDASPIYSDETFTLGINPNTFVDSSGNYLPAITGDPVTNGSTLAYPTGATFIAIASPAYTASDASHLVPCADGDSIRWWKDAVSGTWYEQATSGDRLILRANGAKWYAEGGGTRFHSFATPSMPGSAGMACVRFAGQTTGVMWTPLSVNTSDYARFSFNGERYSSNFRNPRADFFGTPPPDDTSPHTFTQVSGADYRAYLDTSLVGTTTASWQSPIQCVVGKGDVVGSQNIAAAAVYPDGTNRAEVETWIARFM